MVSAIEEIGVLDNTCGIFTKPEVISETPVKSGDAFAAMINKKLSTSKKKVINIFLHGYKVSFENPLLIAGELWHYLGNDGVFIAYSWPTAEKGTAYFGDTDKANWASRNFRHFLQYLSESTNAENINIIAFSMGTRVATFALKDLALIHQDGACQDFKIKMRIGNVILISSDLSTYLISSFLNDGLLDMVQTLTIYTSGSDIVLGTSSWLYRRKRLGQITPVQIKSGEALDFLKNTKKLMIIDATHAAGSNKGNGHHYFRKSPWVSSDILMFLTYNLPPETRGLTQSRAYVWQFPEDYTDRLRQTIGKAGSGLRPANTARSD